ncbi:hypothetical protein [Bradyrhizobium sp. 195]|uniref:hypothetical protein n=1 Tax=Bradyrhizobium sp. 195 TaxID=2782662 RepID=UPI0020015F1E|nr:hypothetical protein [Bradyrhizobium sp. 195]UPK28367.1 hypothetical protein IVB26_08110 [Bradyrhizobium sp. 195]
MMAYKRGAREMMAQRLGPTWVSHEHVPDVHTGEPWSEMAVEDLQAAWKTGANLEELSTYLCRDWEDITEKCKELGLDLIYQPQRRQGYLQKWKRQEEKKSSAGGS